MRQLLVGMIFVSIALACVLWLTQSLRFIELIVSKGISVATFLQLTLMLLPSFLVVIIPISLFAVVVFTYNKLTTDRELVVLRAAGLSNWALARPAITLGVVVSLLGYILSMWAIPYSIQSFKEMQWSIRNDFSAVLLQEGVFNKFGDGIAIFVAERSSSGELINIFVHDKRKPTKPVTMMAERGALIFTDSGPRVLMTRGNRQEFDTNTGRMSELHFDSYTVDMAHTIRDDARRKNAEEMSISELLRIDKASMRESNYRKARVELHARLTNSMYILSFAVIGAATLLLSSFQRRGQGQAILGSIGLMVGLQALALGAQNLAACDLSFVPLMYVLAFAPLAVSLWALLREPRYKSTGESAALAR